jgi:hypothetical protein
LGILILVAGELTWARPGAHASFKARPAWVRWSAYYGLGGLLVLLHAVEQSQFIYFQF